MSLTGRQYYYHLDILRFLSAFLVMLFHFSFYTPTSETFISNTWFGWIGVQVFFVISGFVICESALVKSPKQFIVSRAMRLYPAALICGTISFLVLYTWKGATTLEFLKSILLFPKGPFLTSAYWTLPIEIAFYSFVVILITFTNNIKNFRLFAYSLISLSLIYILLYTAHLQDYLYLPFLDLGYGIKNMSLLRHGVFFGLGILLFLWAKEEYRALDLIYLFLAIFTSFWEITARADEVISKYQASFSYNFELISSNGLLPFLWFLGALFFLHFVRISIKEGFTVVKKCIRVLGLITYPLYLMHESIGFYVKHVIEKNLSFIQPLPATIIGCFVAIFVAYLVAHFAEPKIRDFIKKRQPIYLRT